MGYWGPGPFDNDSALDFLGDVAETHARVENGGIVTGSVNMDGAEESLARALGQGARAETYAAAGLVAAALSGEAVRESQGTRLFAAVEAHATGAPLEGGPLGLGTHCGHVALLDRTAASRLLPAALGAARHLARFGQGDSSQELVTLLESLMPGTAPDPQL